MLFDVAAWVVILLAGWAVGGCTLALLRVQALRPGDAFVIRAWLGVIVLAAVLLATSIAVPLTPTVASSVVVSLIALGVGATRTAPARGTPSRAPNVYPIAAIAGIVAGATLLAAGAAALTSDPVTLYDSLVYHVGIIRWLSEHGTVPGLALIHNRLGHVSAWFAVAAPFDHGFASNRSATVPLGVALVLAGLQSAIAVGRAVARSALVADWFFILLILPFLWAVVARGAATPSPDVATNVLIAVAGWSILAVSRTDRLESSTTLETGRAVIPLFIAVGAASMKLFAVPSVAVTAILFMVWTRRGEGMRSWVTPAIAVVSIAALMLTPFVAANVVASGCPAYPSPVGCLGVSWSYGTAQASDYADYIRAVARWDRRGNTPPNDVTGWILPWVGAHPVVTILSILSATIGIGVLRRTRGVGRVAMNAVVAQGLFGIAFALWQAPAPRFLYAVALVIPALAGAYGLSMIAAQRPGLPATPAAPRRFAAGFSVACLLVGVAYAVASQKLNVRSAVVSGAPLVQVAKADLLLPTPPQEQTRLYRWRVNDVDVFTPVPLPIADTLGYHSAIAYNADFEKCSTAPLPCTPYLPRGEVRLRHPARGIAGGFTRASDAALTRSVTTCLGPLVPGTADERGFRDAIPRRWDPSACWPNDR